MGRPVPLEDLPDELKDFKPIGSGGISKTLGKEVPQEDLPDELLPPVPSLGEAITAPAPVQKESINPEDQALKSQIENPPKLPLESVFKDIAKPIVKTGYFAATVADAIAASSIPGLNPEVVKSKWEAVRQAGEEAPLETIGNVAGLLGLAHGISQIPPEFRSPKGIVEMGKFILGDLKAYPDLITQSNFWRKIANQERGLVKVSDEELMKYMIDLPIDVQKAMIKRSSEWYRIANKIRGAGAGGKVYGDTGFGGPEPVPGEVPPVTEAVVPPVAPPVTAPIPDFVPRTNITPDIADKTRVIADIDPLAALKNVTPVSEWNKIDEFAKTVIADIPNQQEAQVVLKGVVEDIIGPISPLPPEKVVEPPVKPQEVPAPPAQESLPPVQEPALPVKSVQEPVLPAQVPAPVEPTAPQDIAAPVSADEIDIQIDPEIQKLLDGMPDEGSDVTNGESAGFMVNESKLKVLADKLTKLVKVTKNIPAQKNIYDKAVKELKYLNTKMGELKTQQVSRNTSPDAPAPVQGTVKPNEPMTRVIESVKPGEIKPTVSDIYEPGVLDAVPPIPDGEPESGGPVETGKITPDHTLEEEKAVNSEPLKDAIVSHAKEQGLDLTGEQVQKFVDEFKSRFHPGEKDFKEAYGEQPVTKLVEQIADEWKSNIQAPEPLKLPEIPGILSPQEIFNATKQPEDTSGLPGGPEEPGAVVTPGPTGIPPLEGVLPKDVPGPKEVGGIDKVGPVRGGPDAGNNVADRERNDEGGPVIRISQPERVGTSKGDVATPASGGGQSGLQPGAGNYRITPADHIGEGSLKEKVANNILAIQTLKNIEAEGRMATPAEQKILVKYVGWGAVSQIFDWRESDKWEKESKIISGLLSDEEYNAARASTMNAFYTSPEVITEIHKALIHFGFTGGRVFEPAMGVGHFFGLMPKDMIAKSTLTGIELDSITGRIAKQLYQHADIRVKGFEEVALPDGFYSVAEGNPPFGDMQVNDPKYNRFKFLIHDYFFAKSIDKIAPGGILAFITSHGTMDKVNTSLRSYLNDKSIFIGAIRLPSTAFKENAGTEVVTDIIFLQKKFPGQTIKSDSWLETGPIKLINKYKQEQEYPINKYFIDHPEMILGKQSGHGSMYGASQYTVSPLDKPLKTSIEEAVKRLPSNIFKINLPKVVEQIPAPDELKQGSLTIQDKKVYQKIGDMLVEVRGGERERIKALIDLKNQVNHVITNQLRGDVTDKELETDRKALNKIYDKFVAKYGNVSSKLNVETFGLDPDAAKVRALENVNDLTEEVTKTLIFTKRVSEPIKTITKSETVQDAMYVSLAEKNKIDFDRIAELTEKTPETIKNELYGLIYNDPEIGWVPKEEYLSGHVKQKLEVAKSMAEHNPELFSDNVKALESAIPKDLGPDQISARLGSPWIPPEYIDQFISAIMDTYRDLSKTAYVDNISLWKVELSKSGVRSLAWNTNNTNKWGTDRAPAIDLIKGALNNKAPEVRDRLPEGGTVVNKQATAIAKQKYVAIKAEFKRWVWDIKDDSDKKRVNDLIRIYNDKFNTIALRTYDGSHLVLPGISSNLPLDPHQKNAVYRILQSPTTLLAHEVGLGKTFIMIAAGMEMRRVGLRKKPMYVVPNHMISQWTQDFMRLYPNAKILASTKQDFEADNRKLFMSKAATGDWDGVIVTHTQFNLLPMASKVYLDFIREQIADLENAIQTTVKAEGVRSITVKELEKAKANLKKKLETALKKEKKDTGVLFEETGVDQLFIDESQAFKNLYFATRMNRVAGMGSGDADRAMDMFLKTVYVSKLNNGGGIVFASGTPISNTMAEAYTLERYLTLLSLRDVGLSQFDSWAKTFGEVEDKWEISPDGSRFKVRSSFSKFNNVAELRKRFRLYADVKRADEVGIKRPKVKGGKPEVVAVELSPDQKAYIEKLVYRVDHMGSDKKKDNMLKVTTDGMKAALDMRIIDPSMPDFIGSKLNMAVKKVYEIWTETKEKKLTQLVFCDLSVPNEKNKKGFSVYRDMKAKWIALGIPKEEIAFIHDYPKDEDKANLFKDVNTGKIRILLGSRDKMGVGTNVQKLLYAAHSLDVPWTADKLDQADGRIIRRGNTNLEIRLIRYVTRGSFDAYKWQTVERKAIIFSKFMSGNMDIREMEDIDGSAMSATEVKGEASGNPLVREKIENDTALMNLQILEGAYKFEKYKVNQELGELPVRLNHIESEIPKLQADIETFNKAVVYDEPKKEEVKPGEELIPVAEKPKEKKEVFRMTVNGIEHKERKSAGEALVEESKKLRKAGVDQEIEVGVYKGMPMFVFSSASISQGNEIFLRGKGADYSGFVTEPLGTVASLDYNSSVSSIEARISNLTKEIAKIKERIHGLEAEAKKEFPYAKEVEERLLKQTDFENKLGLNKVSKQDIVNKDDEDKGGDDEDPESEDAAYALDDAVVDQAKDNINAAMAVNDEVVQQLRKEFKLDIPVEVGTIPELDVLIPTLKMIKPMELPEMIYLAERLTGSVPTLKKFRRALGMFYGEGNGHIKFRPDIFADVEVVARIAAHEIGHGFDYMDDKTFTRGNLRNRVQGLNNELSKEFGDKELKNKELRQELMALSEYWRPIDRNTASANYIKTRMSSIELYADAISVLLNNPGLLEKMAPKFYKAFFDNLDKKPNVKKEYFELMTLYNGNPDDIHQLRAERMEESFAQAAEIQREKRIAKTKKDYGRMFDVLKTSFQNSNYHILEKIRGLERKGEIIPEHLNPKYLLENNSMSDNDVHTMLGQIEDYVSKPAKDHELTDLEIGQYVALQRMMGDRAQIANPWGFTVKTAPVDMDFLRKRIGEERWQVLQQVVERFHDLNFLVVQEMADVGFYSEKFMEEVAKASKYSYATFTPVEHVQDYVPAGIRQQVGSLKGIANPYLQTLLKMVAMKRAISLQRAKIGFRDIWLQHFPDEISRAVRTNPGFEGPATFRREEGKGLIVIKEDGKEVGYIVDPFIENSFSKSTDGDSQLMVHFARMFFMSNLFHGLLITYNPGFALFFNPLKDFKQTYVALNALGARVTIGSLIKTMIKAYPMAKKKALGIKDEYIDEMVANHALNLSFDDVLINDTDDTYMAMLRRFGLIQEEQNIGEIRKTLLRPVLILMNKMKVMSATTEVMSKVAGNMELQKIGQTGNELSYNVRNYIGTPNFKNKGDVTKFSNVVAMFSNVMIQGFVSSYELATNPQTKGGYWYSRFKTDILPKFLMILAGAGLLGKVLKDLYDRIPEYDKTNYLCIPLGTKDGGDYGYRAVYLRIPHDHAGQVVSSLFWKIANVYKNQPKKWTQVLDVGAQQMSTGLAPAGKIYLNWWLYLTGNNPYDYFKGRPVINETDFKAGGMPAFKGMMYWTMDQTGWVKLANYNSTTDTTTETIFKVTPILNRAIKISDYGMVEKDRGVIDLNLAERSQHLSGRTAEARTYTQRLTFLRNLKSADSLTPQQENEYYRLSSIYSVYQKIDKSLRDAEQKGDVSRVEKEEKAIKDLIKSTAK